MPETLRSQSTAPCAVSLALTLQRQQIFSIAVGDLGCRLGPERRQVRKQMALRFPSPFHDVGRRRVPAAGGVESGCVVVPSSSAQFCSSVSLDRCACRPVDQLVVLVPERLPGPAVIVGQLHVEGLAPALQRVAVILGVLPEPADQVASTIASFGLFIATQAFRTRQAVAGSTLGTSTDNIKIGASLFQRCSDEYVI